MINYFADYKYINSNGVNLFAAFMLPCEGGKFPVVVIRTPYEAKIKNLTEDEILAVYADRYKMWLKRGYAVAVEHCKGTGKSEGDFIPYINEREDGLHFQSYIREQDFYNGEIFLWGESYLSSVHYATAPFAKDIKGAVFNVQDWERYNICYRNGFLKRGLHGGWYANVYKVNSGIKKNYSEDCFNILPFTEFTKTVFGEGVEDFDKLILSPDKNNDFWNTRLGGSDARGATNDVDFPILFTTGFNDLYTGGMFDMWNSMSKKSRNMSAFVVSPYNHSDSCSVNSIEFPNGNRKEAFGKEYEAEWFDYIRGKAEKPPFKQGEITYYRLFENKWKTEKEVSAEKNMEITLGSEEISYVYNPYDPPKFKGGLSRGFDGALFQDKPNSRHDIKSFYTEPFESEVFVKGKMSANLKVISNCEDTCFFIRVSIEKEVGDFPLRDDITSLLYQLDDYKPNTWVNLCFEFDEHAFLIKKGERLRIDLASADAAHYVRHTNNKGLFSVQTTAKVAQNSIDLSNSKLILPIE